MKTFIPALPVTAPGPAPDAYFIVCYENEILPFFEGELERLYGNVFSSLAHFVVYGGLDDAGAFLMYRDAELVTMLLFRRSGRKVEILNEGILFGQEELARLVHFIFDRFASVDAIYFKAVRPTLKAFRFPYQRINCCEDIVLDLPGSVDAYVAQLGKASRKSIRQHLSRAQRLFPSFRFVVCQNEEVREEDVREIIRFNKMRMAGKRKVSTFDEEEIARIVRLAKMRGFIGLLLIGDKICAGTLCYQIGANYSSRVNAHDPAYDRFRFGTLCCFLTICACIDRGGREFHFLWGRYAYKYLLLGVQHDLDNLTVFRSTRHMLRHAGSVMREGVRSYRRQARLLAAQVLHAARRFWLARQDSETPPA